MPTWDQRRRQFERLLAAHGAALMAVLRRTLPCGQDADDAFQETAVRVWKHLATAPRLRSPRAWLLTIGYRVAVDSRSRRPVTVPLDTDCCAAGAPTPDERAVQRETAEAVEALVAQLPPGQRDVVALHYAGGLSLRATAAAMELPVGTVKTRLNQALRKLREQLQ